jgi:glycosyltransferase involved in cell wall biosynthesis
MNEVVNTKSKPYIVLEGHVDEQMQYIENRLENKSEPKVLMYAGSLKKVYGIEKLTEAFLAADISGWEFHIYGDGNFREDLEKICKNNSTVKYCGIKLNREIVEAEIKASLLVNPRPTGEDYVKYSFPSKNMEYMASGTPIITTHLPGMPDEYIPYIYLFEEENTEDITRELVRVLSLPSKELHEKGKIAKRFVLENKSSIQQSSKIIELIQKIK